MASSMGGREREARLEMPLSPSSSSQLPDWQQQQQRRDPHTSRAQRARGRCAVVHLRPRVVCTWRFTKKIAGFVTSRSEPRPKLPQHGYHSSIVACCAVAPTFSPDWQVALDQTSEAGLKSQSGTQRATGALSAYLSLARSCDSAIACD